MLSGFKFKDELEEKFIQGRSVEETTAAVAEADADLEAGKNASHRKKKGKKQAPPSSDDEHAEGGEGTSCGGGGKDQKEDAKLELELGDERKDKESSDEPMAKWELLLNSARQIGLEPTLIPNPNKSLRYTLFL
jgi:hypothetical protein